MAPNPAEHVLRFADFPGTGEPSYLLPWPTPDNRPFFDALSQGRLLLRQCSDCDRFRYPAAPVCPYCRSAAFNLVPVSGHGIVHSWIRYHKSYLPEWDSLIPYVVLQVQLDEGVRIFGRLVDRAVEPHIDMPVQAIIERWPAGQHVWAFVAVDGDA